MMDREEWITSKEAFELGFSTTQTRNEPMQALEANFIYNLVMKNKNIQNQIEEKAKEMADEILKEKCKGTTKQKPVGLDSELNNKVNEGSWESFFNTKF